MLILSVLFMYVNCTLRDLEGTFIEQRNQTFYGHFCVLFLLPVVIYYKIAYPDTFS